MSLWEMIGLGVAGYLAMGSVVDIYATWGRIHGKVQSFQDTEFFYLVIKDVRWYAGKHAVTMLLWFTIPLLFLLCFLRGGVQVLLSGAKRERTP